MNQQQIEYVILRALYEAWAISDSGCNLFKMAEENSWNRTSLEKILKRLTHERLIEPRGVVVHEITSVGIVHAENNRIAPEELSAKNTKARDLIMKALLDIYNEEGPDGDAHYTQLARKLSIDDDLSMKNTHVLHMLGYLEETSVGSYSLSQYGLRTMEDYTRRRAIADEFEKLAQMEPHARGRILQKFLAALIGAQGWTQLEGVKTSNEEMDIIVYQKREHYLIECKWEKSPIEGAVIRELYGKLGNRVDVKGIAVSMSGFTAGAIKQVQDYMNIKIILLFGPEDVRSLVYGQATFEDMLDKKYTALVTTGSVLLA